MADLERAAYWELRTGVIDLLVVSGVPINSNAGDVWLLNQLRRKLQLAPVESYDEKSAEAFHLFQSSLSQVIVELGGYVPEPDGRGQVLEARRLVYTLLVYLLHRPPPPKK